MDTVPVVFIESVLQSCGDNLPKEIPHAWAQLGEAYLMKCGSLILTYAPSDLQNYALPWAFRYNLRGFSHLKEKTLSREVIRKIARSITYFKFDTNYKCIWSAHVGRWPSIADDDDATFQLLANLQAPKKELIVDVDSLSHWYGALGPRYSYFWRSFTSLSLRKDSYFSTPVDDCRSTFAQFMKDVVPTARLQRIEVFDNISDIAAVLPANFWAEYLLSESCTGFDFPFGPDMAAEVASGVIQRWKEMDPRRLPQKTFARMSLRNVNRREFTKFVVEPLDEEILKNIPPHVSKEELQTYTAYTEHPIYSGFRIYAVFMGSGTKIVQKTGKTKRFSKASCSLRIE
uniref:FBA_2 domain-containing protein n=1 Tax=Steinernema glaseri TaxID=37863 RepID=A0A1I8A6E7_9BILA